MASSFWIYGSCFCGFFFVAPVFATSFYWSCFCGFSFSLWLRISSAISLGNELTFSYSPLRDTVADLGTFWLLVLLGFLKTAGLTGDALDSTTSFYFSLIAAPYLIVPLFCGLKDACVRLMIYWEPFVWRGFLVLENYFILWGYLIKGSALFFSKSSSVCSSWVWFASEQHAAW